MSTGAAQMCNIFNQSVNVNKVGVSGAKAFFEAKTTFNKGKLLVFTKVKIFSIIYCYFIIVAIFTTDIYKN